MRRALVVLVCFALLASSLHGGELLLPDGTPLSQSGGLIIGRQGNQTIVSFGGVLLPRKVRVTTNTPHGPVITRFTLPSSLCSPTMPPWLETAPGYLQVDIPDRYGQVYIEDVLVEGSGPRRYFQSPPLPPGQDHLLRLRGVFQLGKHLLIEDRQVLLRAGQWTAVTFTGRGATAVPFPPEAGR